MQISDFDYALPDDLIARYPAAERRASRLLELGPAIVDRRFAELPDLLSPGDLLVFNDTRVIPARLAAVKDTGGRVEILIERNAPVHVIRDHAEVARDTVSDDQPELSERIDRATTDLRARESRDRETPVGEEEPARTGSDDADQSRTEERDATTTTSPATDTTRHRDRSGDG